MSLNQSILEMLKSYSPSSVEDYEYALKEVIQEVSLLGLWRAKFFEHGVFYGGTALRIVHQLPRFSEDLDFSLLAPNPTFDITPYMKAVALELTSYGFEVTVNSKIKRQSSAIESAFVKANTMIHLVKVNAPTKTHPSAVLKIKIEIDRDPPLGFKYESKFHISPIPFSIKMMTLPSLFAGKMHALLCRKRVYNVKGRDWYDMIWYVKNKIPVNRYHLKQRMVQSKNIEQLVNLNHKHLLELLRDKISNTNFILAQEDVKPFIKNVTERQGVEQWSAEFFTQAILSRLESVDNERL